VAAPALLDDPKAWADRPLVASREEIYRPDRLPHRHEMALLDGIVHVDLDERFGVGFHDARPEHFWVRGHVPGRPLMPGVLIVEVAAQLCSWVTSFLLDPSADSFFGFAGVDAVRFRGQIRPGDRLVVAAKLSRLRRSFATYHAQGWVDGAPVFEGTILGAMI